MTLVDSSASGAVMQISTLQRPGGTLAVVAPNGSAAAVILELTGLRAFLGVRVGDAALA